MSPGSVIGSLSTYKLEMGADRATVGRQRYSSHYLDHLPCLQHSAHSVLDQCGRYWIRGRGLLSRLRRMSNHCHASGTRSGEVHPRSQDDSGRVGLDRSTKDVLGVSSVFCFSFGPVSQSLYRSQTVLLAVTFPSTPGPSPDDIAQLQSVVDNINGCLVRAGIDLEGDIGGQLEWSVANLETILKNDQQSQINPSKYVLQFFDLAV